MDVIEQLKSLVMHPSEKATIAAAINEIERLRAENAKLKEEIEDLENSLIEAAEMADYYD